MKGGRELKTSKGGGMYLVFPVIVIVTVIVLKFAVIFLLFGFFKQT